MQGQEKQRNSGKPTSVQTVNLSSLREMRAHTFMSVDTTWFWVRQTDDDKKSSQRVCTEVVLGLLEE